jgi:hypothetical protein
VHASVVGSHCEADARSEPVLLGLAETQIRYLLVYLIERLTEPCFDARPPVVGEVAGKLSRLFQQYPHVL